MRNELSVSCSQFTPLLALWKMPRPVVMYSSSGFDGRSMT